MTGPDDRARADQETSFTVRGSRNGSLVHITWSSGGRLRGDPPTVDLVEAEAEAATVYAHDPAFGKAFSDEHGPLPPDPLQDAASAFRLIRRVLDVVREVKGDVPPGVNASEFEGSEDRA